MKNNNNAMEKTLASIRHINNIYQSHTPRKIIPNYGTKPNCRSRSLGRLLLRAKLNYKKIKFVDYSFSTNIIKHIT